jgi:hypothetical protein
MSKRSSNSVRAVPPVPALGETRYLSAEDVKREMASRSMPQRLTALARDARRESGESEG